MRSLLSKPLSPYPSPAMSSGHHHRPPRTPKENVEPDPSHHTSIPHHSPFKSPSAAATSAKPLGNRNRSPLPPRPPPSTSNPLKRKLWDAAPQDVAGGPQLPASASDSGVQVVVRIRPPMKEEEEGEEDLIVRKLAADSIAISGQDFTFDSVADATATQEDIFLLVGLPLVENCLSGFNSSIFAYGQTGSGKTYTMWGPPCALVDDGRALSNERGLTPRVFERLFLRIGEEQAKHADQQLTYQCCCSFLEIYNEQITDLLDPSQRNLQIREDVKTGVYVESLRKEFVFTLKDVTQLLIKGLANRRTGATSVNADSSRSHCVFTCVIESQCKSMKDGSNSLRIRRINLVDLAGSERQKLTHAIGERLKEAGNINRSLSQLGNLINILAEVSQTGKQRHIPYRDSRLTFLLQESLGGNAKLAMICAVSPSQSCKSETLSTLRFAQRAKAIKNKAVINEIRQDDVNVLREQIRQLKDELLRMKSNAASSVGDGSYSTGWSARQSLNLLRLSLNRPALPAIKDDSDEEMEIDENDVEKPCDQTSLETSSVDDKESNEQENPMEIDTAILHVEAAGDMQQMSCNEVNVVKVATDIEGHTRRSKLAASIQRGLQVIESQRNNAAWRRASFSFPVRPVDAQSTLPVCKVDSAIQTDPEESDGQKTSLTLAPTACENEASQSKDISNVTNLQLVLVDRSLPADELKKPAVLKAVEKVLAGSIRREMALEDHCARQAAEIRQLNRLVQQYKHERECNAVIAQTREAKIARLEILMDGILPTEDFMQEEYISLFNEHKLLQKKYENHPDVVCVNIELKRVQEELEKYRNFFDLDEKDVLLEEIQDLKNQLQYYMLSSLTSVCRSNPPLQLSQRTHPPALLDTEPETQEGDADEKLERSHNWTEAESKWITLTEELRVELETNRSLAEKLRLELESEKKCAEETKEALQTAMQGHARILELYADLEEKHISLLATHRRISEGIEDVKKAAAKAGVKGAESKFINSLAAEISVLRADREKERRYWRDENKGLQAQLRDTAEAVQAAGELLVRLKEAEEATALAQKRAAVAEQETEKAYQEIDNLKRNYDREILLLNQLLGESRLPHDALMPAEPSDLGTAKYDGGGSQSDEKWREEFEAFRQGGSTEVSKSTDPGSWFFGYDRCNI